jgi:cbb3-type cytochrome oxidase subunit 3
MRKCVLLFLLLVFVLIIASVTENRERAAANEKVAMEVNNSESLAQDNTALNNEHSR